MDAQALQFLTVGDAVDARQIAVLAERGDLERTGVLWLSGFKSDMLGTKAQAVAEFSSRHAIACTRFDYSGHGRSGGRFDEGTISRWLAESRAVFERSSPGPRVLVGSSMGGYLALLLLRELMETAPVEAERIKALLLIAPAWDMTERLMWDKFSSRARDDILVTGRYLRPSDYDDGGYPITRVLIDDGRHHLLGSRAFDPGRPVLILHGLLDPDVPWEHTLDLDAHLSGGWTRIEAIPDGDHRLSRPEDIELLLRTLGDLLGSTGSGDRKQG